MSTRIDEMKGQIKQGVGTVSGNDEMQREGQTEAEAAKLRREAEGTVDKGVGKVQETVGDVTDDPETELKGKARQVEGDIKRSG
jgi:uncharacterized protein YjbJ (UPF0337 family)